MHRTFSKLAIVGAAFVVLIGLSILTTGQPAPKLRRQPASPHHVGVVDDWSFHHLVYSNPGTYEQAIANGTYSKWLNIQYDARYIMQQMKRNPAQGALARGADFVTLAGRLGAPVGRPEPIRRPPPPTPRRNLKKDWSMDLNGAGVIGTVNTNNASGSPLSGVTIDSVALNASPPTPATQTGTFSSAPLTTSSPITVTNGTNVLTVTTGGTGQSYVGTVQTPLTPPLSATTISVTSGSHTLTLSNGGTPASALGYFVAPPLTSTSISIQSGSNTLNMTTNATPSTATGTFSAVPLANTTISVTSGSNGALVLSNGGTGSNATGTFSGPPLAGTSISVTSGTNTLAMTTNATPGTANGTFSGTSTGTITITNTAGATSNALVLTMSSSGTNTCTSSTAGTVLNSSTASTEAGNVATAITNCYSSYPAIGVNATHTGTNTYFTVTATTPGPFLAVSESASSFSWGSVSGNSAGSATCSSSTAGTFATVPSGTNGASAAGLGDLASNLSAAITACNTSHSAVGATGSYTSGSSFTVTDTTPGDFTTFSVGGGAGGIFSWGSGVTAGTDGSGACTTKNLGTYATASTTLTLAGNLAAAINACNTSYPAVGATAHDNGNSSFTVSNTTPGTTSVSTFSVGATGSGFSWGSGVTAGTNGSASCSGSGTSYSGTFITSNTMSTLAGNFNTALNTGTCPASVGFSSSHGTFDTYVTVTDTAVGSFPTFTPGTNAPSSIFYWTPTSGTNGSNACTSSTAGTYATSNDPATLASNISAAINACYSYSSTVGATSNYGGANTFTVTDTTIGPAANTFTTATNASSSTFSWSGKTDGTIGSNGCSADSTTATYQYSTTNSTLATNLSAAINLCTASVTGVTSSHSGSNTYATITAATPGSGGLNIDLSPTATGYFKWTAGTLAGTNLDGVTSGTTWAYWSGSTRVSEAQVAANIAYTINHNSTLGPLVIAIEQGNQVSVTALTEGAGGDYGVSKANFDGFGWSGSALGGVGTATVQPNTSPAKFSFSSTTADCTNDFVVYPTGMAGSASKTIPAQVVAYNNLYVSGCTGTVPSVYWAYNTAGTDTGAAVTTSPILSPEGRQVAFIQTGGAAGATLVLLKWGPVPAGTLAVPGSYAAGTLDYRNSGGDYRAYTSGPVYISLVFKNGNNDTYSQPFYDYSSGQDAIYVGDDSGYLHKFTGVFYGSPSEAGAPWPVLLNASYKVTSPVYDPTSGLVFVGNTGGYLYAVGTGTGTPTPTTDGQKYSTSGQLGGTTSGGILDGPLVDPSAGTVYAFVTTNGTYNLVFRLLTSFASGSTGQSVAVGTGGTAAQQYYLYDGTFDNVYYGSSAPAGNLWVVGNTSSTSATLYRIPMVPFPATGTTHGTTSVTSTSGIASQDVGAPIFGTGIPAGDTISAYSSGTATLATAATQSITGEALSLGAKGNTNGTTSVTITAGPTLTTADIGVQISGTGIPAGDTIANVSGTNGWTVTLTTAATATNTGVLFALNGMGAAATPVTGVNDGHQPWPSPITEFCNNGASECTTNGTTTTAGIDYLFFSVNRGNVGGNCTDENGNGCVLAYTITTPTATPTLSGSLNVVADGGSGQAACWATGGIIVDNSVPSGTLAGASQVYFIGLNGNTAGGASGTPTSSTCAPVANTYTIQATQASQSALN